MNKGLQLTKMRGQASLALKRGGRTLFRVLRDVETLRVLKLEDLFGTQSDDLLIEVNERTRQFPWELVFDGNDFLCTRYNMGRTIVNPTAKYLSGYGPEHKRALVVGINYDGMIEEPLHYAEREARAVSEELTQIGYRTQLLIGQEATLDAVTERLSGGVSVFHFTGHGEPDSLMLVDDFLDRGNLEDCFRTARGAPYLSFLNTCGSAQETVSTDLVDSFVNFGAEHVIGTFWSVYDEPSITVSRDFYRQLLSGATIGAALRHARSRCLSTGGVKEGATGGAYVLYGNPSYRLKKP